MSGHRRSRRRGPLLLLAVAALFCGLGISPGCAADEDASYRRPVRVVADRRIEVENGELPLFVSGDWSAPLSGVRRAVVVLHGRLRNADAYYRAALKAQAAAGGLGAESLIIAPQFLAGVDLAANGLSNRTLQCRA